MFRTLRLGIGAVVLALTLAAIPTATVAQTTIGFNGLTGANGDAFTPYLESGYRVSVFQGAFCEAWAYGNEAPGLWAGGGCTAADEYNTLSVTRSGGGLFRWLAIDLSPWFGDASWNVSGFRDAGLVWFDDSRVTQDAIGWVTEASNFKGDEVDEILFEFYTPPSRGLLKIDNIVVVVPEPGSMMLVASGLLGLVWFARRRRKDAIDTV